MAKNLVIVESPGKIKSISRYLGKNYKVKASVGHVRDLPKSQLGVDIENDFEPKYITIRGKGDIIAELKKEAKAADHVFLATDPDREGEAISWHLAKLLNIDEKEKCRITFNEITKNAIEEAIKKPRNIDMNLVDAQQARRVLDRIVGYKISPILWRKVKKGLSAGRVQSVAMRLICDREEEIENFIPEEYWSLTADLTQKNKRKVFQAKFYGRHGEKIELGNEETVRKIIEEIGSGDFVVANVKKGTKKTSPPPPFTTSTLQQEASRKLGFPTKKTMMLAQQLYEGVDIKGHGTLGLVTYIRTDSTRVSEGARKEAMEYIQQRFTGEYVPEKPNVFRNRSAAQDAHESIRPSYINLEPEEIKDSLTRDQYRLYKLIWERFIASQMAAAVYDTISATITAGQYEFRTTGSKVKFPGYMKVYTEGRDNDTDEDENEADIPDLKEGEILDLKKLEPKQHFTQPPSRYTEATLVKTLEEKGIGRPSTYAPIITTILSRGYVVRDKKVLIPTELGRIVTDIMKNHFDDIVDEQFTAHMESQLDEIEEGKKNWKEIIRDFYRAFSIELDEAEKKIGEVEIPDEVTDVKCEFCGRNMVIKQSRFGKFLACPGFPECKNTKPILEKAGVKCPKCGGEVIIRKTRKGRKYIGCENYPNCDFLSWDMPSGKTCPECGKFMLQKYSGNKIIYKCSNENCSYQTSETRK